MNPAIELSHEFGSFEEYRKRLKTGMRNRIPKILTSLRARLGVFRHLFFSARKAVMRNRAFQSGTRPSTSVPVWTKWLPLVPNSPKPHTLSPEISCHLLSFTKVNEYLPYLFWGPYNKDPTIWGTILGSPIFGNPQIKLASFVSAR